MKVYISCDMEGITGVNIGKQTSPNDSDYGRFRKLMTQDVNAAIEGALEAGATEFVVNDAHGPMTNILIEELNAKARLISGVNKHLCQMEGINESFDLVFFIGYHAREGSEDAVINHTLLGSTVYEIRCNGEPVDEAAINAGTAGHFGVPIGLLAGDHVVCEHARARFGGVETAVVKEAIDRFTANSLTPKAAHALIREKAAAAVKNAGSLNPYEVATPVRFEVDFKATPQAHMCDLLPFVTRTGNRTITLSGDDYVSAFKQLWGALLLARAGQSGTL